MSGWRSSLWAYAIAVEGEVRARCERAESDEREGVSTDLSLEVQDPQVLDVADLIDFERQEGVATCLKASEAPLVKLSFGVEFGPFISPTEVLWIGQVRLLVHSVSALPTWPYSLKANRSPGTRAIYPWRPAL